MNGGRPRVSLRDYVPSTAAARTFAFTSFVSSVGTGLFLAGSAVFFVRSVGLSTTEVGLALTLSALVGLVATVPVGALTDQWSAPRVLAGLQLWRIAWLVALAFTTGPVPFTIVASALAVADGATPPVIQAVVASVSGPGDRPRTRAIIQTVRNLGFSAGALLAAPLLAADSTWTFRLLMLGYAALVVPSVALLLRMSPPQRIHAVRPGLLRGVREFRDWRYGLLTLLNGVLCLHVTLLSVGLPLWALRTGSVPVGLVPLLTFINTVLVVILQVPLSRRVSDPGGPARVLRTSGVFLAACCLLLALVANTPPLAASTLLLLGCVLLTLGELSQSIGGWELSHQHAPEGRHGTYLAVFGLSLSGQRIAGPALVTGVVIAAGPWGWVGLAALFALAAGLTRPSVRAVERHRLRQTPPTELPEPAPGHRETRDGREAREDRETREQREQREDRDRAGQPVARPGQLGKAEPVGPEGTDGTARPAEHDPHGRHSQYDQRSQHDQRSPHV
ncbi:MFS transporter [Streptomyces sp. AJS327]|uniref:MFS transporter n=1 Tax=Streptomyces sp. AJS327 TaxID=2545265 RepID=UPI0015DEBE84|nr:MFS transporter [Streptomyces sp. AJS327]MBA0052851.1 MFS transporter [Streptomyces sp. AJS327]